MVLVKSPPPAPEIHQGHQGLFSRFLAVDEDLIVYKVVAFRPQDIDDAEKLLDLHTRSIRIPRVRRLVHQFCEVLEDTARLETLDRLLRQRALT
ncbi:MAG TPA: hypothetical protein VEK15_22195 [Vicinamibacteria bacterium]|nr:hypothetical protein [Vicinamibacteria bacterium]